MFESLSSSSEVPYYGSNKNGRFEVKQRVAIVCSIAAICCRHLLLLDYCDVIASLSLGENKMAASRSKMAIFNAPIICYKVDDRANYCYFQIFHGMNFHLR